MSSSSSASKNARAAPGASASVSGMRIDDAVVAGHRLGVDAEPLAQPGADRQRPWPVDGLPVRRMDDQPPVAELVAASLDDELAVVRDVAGVAELLADE